VLEGPAAVIEGSMLLSSELDQERQRKVAELGLYCRELLLCI
jgi:hypothetical protein